jgi:hypothetical protein
LHHQHVEDGLAEAWVEAMKRERWVLKQENKHALKAHLVSILKL